MKVNRLAVISLLGVLVLSGCSPGKLQNPGNTQVTKQPDIHGTILDTVQPHHRKGKRLFTIRLIFLLE